MSTSVDPALLLRVSADIAQRLAATRDAVAVAETVLPALVDALHAEVGNVILKADERTLRLLATVGLSDAVVQDWAEFDVSAAIPLAATVRDGQARWLTDVRAAAPEYPAIPPGSNASLCTLPLLDGDKVIGVLGLAWKEPHEFLEAEQQLLLTVAALASATLARHPLPARSRLVVRDHQGAPGVTIAELAREGGARCIVHTPADASPRLSASVTLLDADPGLPTRTIDAIDGVLAFCRLGHSPPAVVGQVVADLSSYLEGTITGGQIEISASRDWLAVAPLDHAVVIATAGQGSGEVSPPAPGVLAGERVLLTDAVQPATALTVALDARIDPSAADAVTIATRCALERAAGQPAAEAVRVLLTELLAREYDEGVRGAVAVVLERATVSDPSAPAAGASAVPPLRYARRLPAAPVSAVLGRRFALATLPPDLHEIYAERLALVVDELVANAIRHASDTIEVVVSYLPRGIEIGVTDDDDRYPEPDRAGATAESGRGYTLLSALATELGVTPRAGGGKIVWARLLW